MFSFLKYLIFLSLINTIHCEPTDVDNNDASNNKKETNVSIDENKDVVNVLASKDADNEEYYTIKVKKGVLDNVFDKSKEVLVKLFKEVGPELGVGAATGKAVA